MKIKKIIFAMCAVLGMVACDDSTTTLGSSLIDNMDHLEINNATFNVSSRSLFIDSVYARNSVSYLGTVRDPETGDYIRSNFTTQFHILENYEFPKRDSIMSKNEAGEIIADSVEFRFYFDSFYGDSCVAMKLTAHELDKPMDESVKYYSNYDPKAAGMIREDGFVVSKSYSLTDMNVERSTREDDDYTKNIRITLNKPYTDKNGKTYNNYGSYIMNKYYENPEYFKNSYRFTKNVVPGFYIESTGGLGSMAYIKLTQLNLYFRYLTKIDGKDSTIVGTTSLAGTEEVLISTTVNNDKSVLKSLAEDNSCTYLKTPSGIFTELTLPVEEICKGHENDTINTANITLTRMNNNVISQYSFDIPQTLVMVPKDSLYSFFENNRVANYKTSFLSSYNSSNNTYTFNNISTLVRAMYDAHKRDEDSDDWNKVVLVPVTTSYRTISSTSYLTKVVNDMSFTCTRLVKGSSDSDAIKINVIYSKYK